jgi:hypothetical protein
MIQITQTGSGQLLGTLNHAELKENGSLEQTSNNLTGAVDGGTITLMTKAPAPLELLSTNVSGTIGGGALTLNFPNGSSERFVKADPSEYQTAVQQLSAQGTAIQQQRKIADLDAQVANLNKRLTDYAAMVTGAKNDQQIASFHAAHEKQLERARHGLQMQQKHPRGSVSANEVEVAIIQLQVDLTQYDLDWESVQERGATHLREFDNAIAQSPCAHGHPDLLHCAGQPAAIQAYEAAKPVVQKHGADVAATLKNDTATMQGLVSAARKYASSSN